MPLFSVCCSKGNECLFHREPAGSTVKHPACRARGHCHFLAWCEVAAAGPRSGSATAVPAPFPGARVWGTAAWPAAPSRPGHSSWEKQGDGCFCFGVICSHIPHDSLGMRNTVYLNIKNCEQQGGLYSTLNRAVPFLHGRLSI